MTQLTQEERDTLVKYRLERVQSTLEEANLLFSKGFYSGTVNRLYYACFYAVIALFIKNGVDTPKTHAGAKQKFGELFVITGKIDSKYGRFFSMLFDKRHANDYEDFVDSSQEEAEKFVPQAQEFVDAVAKLLNK